MSVLTRRDFLLRPVINEDPVINLYAEISNFNTLQLELKKKILFREKMAMWQWKLNILPGARSNFGVTSSFFRFENFDFYPSSRCTGKTALYSISNLVRLFKKFCFLATKTDRQKRQVITEGQSIKEFRLLNKYGYEWTGHLFSPREWNHTSRKEYDTQKICFYLLILRAA